MFPAQLPAQQEGDILKLFNWQGASDMIRGALFAFGWCRVRITYSGFLFPKTQIFEPISHILRGQRENRVWGPVLFVDFSFFLYYPTQKVDSQM